MFVAVADYGTESNAGIVARTIDGELGFQIRLDQKLVATWQREIGEEIVERIVSENFLKAQVMEKDVGFEPILRGWKREDVVLTGSEECGVGSGVADEFCGVGGGKFLR